MGLRELDGFKVGDKVCIADTDNPCEQPIKRAGIIEEITYDGIVRVRWGSKMGGTKDLSYTYLTRRLILVDPFKEAIRQAVISKWIS